MAAELSEVFSFLSHERADVRKMAAQGIAQHSKDAVGLMRFLTGPEGTEACTSLVNLLTIQEFPLLGDVLTTLINSSVDASCAEAYVGNKLVSRAIRLLDTLESDSTQPDAAKLVVKEMTLMLLNNITASHIFAVDSLLQLKDEELRGFYISKLATHFHYQPEKCSRDLQRWILQIALNVTRIPGGQEVLVEDEEWIDILTEKSNDEERLLHRLLAIQCLRNCASNKNAHPPLVQCKVTAQIIERLHKGKEFGQVEVQQAAVEFLAGMMQSEAGMQQLEEYNVKRYLVEMIHPSAVAAEAQDSAPITAMDAEATQFVQNNLLPFLDDIQDAYIPEGLD